MKHTQGKIDSFLIEVSETILNPEYIITGEGNESICNLKLDGSITRSELDANAERLIKCWNMHDELVEILIETDKQNGIPPKDWNEKTYKYCQDVKTLIKKATE